MHVYTRVFALVGPRTYMCPCVRVKEVCICVCVCIYIYIIQSYIYIYIYSHVATVGITYDLFSQAYGKVLRLDKGGGLDRGVSWMEISIPISR